MLIWFYINIIYWAVIRFVFVVEADDGPIVISAFIESPIKGIQRSILRANVHHFCLISVDREGTALKLFVVFRDVLKRYILVDIAGIIAVNRGLQIDGWTFILQNRDAPFLGGGHIITLF